ncbi:MAG: DNRLRE domain-containing protein [Tepidisphaeraceae bacterium]
MTLLCSSSTQAAPATLSGTAVTTDGFIYSFNFLATNTMDQLAVYYPTTLAAGVNPSGLHNIRSLMKFDLTGVSFNPATEKATITVTNTASPFGDNPSAAYPVTVGAYGITSAWSTSTTTWLSQPTIAATHADAQVFSSPSGTTTFDISGLMDGWVNGSVANNGVMFISESGPVVSQAGTVFPSFLASRAASGQPVLAIVALPEPATMAGLAIAGLALLRRTR